VNLAERHKSYLVGTLLLIILMVTGYVVSAGSMIKRLDLVFYDLILPLQSPDFSDDIVIIGIDEHSLDELGRWPWSRMRHADLVDELTRLQAKAVGFDILFPEPQDDGTGSDRQLARAIMENGRTVLVVAPGSTGSGSLITELLPVTDLAAEAAALGHVDVELDIDGLNRRAFLYAGLSDARWPAFAIAMMQAAGDTLPEDIKRAGRDAANQHAGNQDAGNQNAWLRQKKVLIPYSDPENGPEILSYVDVLKGRVDAARIRDKYVFVGATAAGLGDAISTPGALSHQRMYGIVLNAQILNGLLQDKLIYELSHDRYRLLSIALIVTVVLGVLLVPFRWSHYMAIAGLALVLLVSVMLLVESRLWFAPSSTLLPVLMVWPLWSVWKYSRQRLLRARLLRQLEHQASHHLATGLPNQNMLLDQLRQLEKQGEAKFVGLMILHINWPGSASVIMDRPISDPILKCISQRLRSITGEQDYIAHLSGDDFAILVSGCEDERQIQDMAAQLLAELQMPLLYQDEKLLLAPQIGLSIWPQDTDDPNSLLRNAYTAMFKSRIDDTEHMCVYSSNVETELKMRSQLEQALVFALERGEFVLYYQPQVDARTGDIVGVESLIRWHNPKLGWVPPDTFIPVAEHVGLIKTIGEWVLQAACKQLLAWNRENLGPIRMAVNVSPLQFILPGLDKGILRILEETGIRPGDLELEITESSLMHDMNSAVQLMQHIKSYGVELAIDDFGTGYSSLSSLRHFPIDRLKIDQSFTREIGVSDDTTEITLTILAMAKHLGMKVIAEGVETPEQAELLMKNGCDEFQGYLYGKPVTADEIGQMLRKTLQMRV